MCKISTLSERIINENKMTPAEVIDFIGEKMEHGKKADEVYKCLYERAYGKVISRSLADMWVSSMAVTDESERKTGLKWNYDTCIEVGSKVGINWSEVSKCEWYAVLNMVYSDYYSTARYAEKQNDPIFYAHLAKDWVYDSDIDEDKTYNYYFSVVCS